MKLKENKKEHEGEFGGRKYCSCIIKSPQIYKSHFDFSELTQLKNVSPRQSSIPKIGLFALCNSSQKEVLHMKEYKALSYLWKDAQPHQL